MKPLHYAHTGLCILFGLFFIYAGAQKFIPKPPRPISNKEALITAIETNTFESPATFSFTMKSMSSSGFLKVVGVLQIIGGLLIVIPKTRLIGLLTLLPVVLNIFLLHFFMDNSMDENIETGILLTINCVLILYYKNSFKYLLVAPIKY
jgi:putative oxidoreductase